MKKIVALVLALALALSLCTVAFAETTTTGTKSDVSVTFTKATLYKLGTGAEGKTAVTATFTSITKTTQVGQLEKDVPVYNADNYTIDFTFSGVVLNATNGKYVFSVVTKDVADYSLKLDNNAEIYLVNDDVYTDEVFTSKVAKAAKVTCGAYVDEDKAYANLTANDLCAAYVNADGDAFVASGNNWGYYNGAFVKYGDEAYAVKHTLAADTYKLDADNNKVPATAKCSVCEKTFNVVVAADLDKDWVKDVNYQQFADNSTNYFAVLDATVGGTTTTTATVDSSKTFDAGVAMYVGLSLMSVAGSAVVIGKKKEF